MTGKDKRGSDSGADAASALQALRQQAEARLLIKAALSPGSIDTLSPDANRKLLHELRVHQIELEMQNEELRDTQVTLDALRARYFDLYDLAPAGYCTVSERGLVMQANLTAASLLGTTRNALLKRPLSRFVHQDDQNSYYLYSKRLKESGEAQSCELRMVKDDGTQFWVHFAGTAAQDADGAFELRAVLSDVTERKRVEAERDAAVAVAEKASRAKTEFLSSMSHELRTPLNAILGFAQLMEAGKPPLTESQQRSIERILKAGWYLLELINEILDLTRIESGKVSLSHEPVALADVMLECRLMLEPLAQQRRVDMTIPRFDIPYFVSADRTRLKQVMTNLLSNAVKYNRPGGTVSVECAPVRPNTMRISVRDTGLGLTPHQLTKLFEPFNRLGKEDGREEGTGIGLVVTKRLVELMGGTIGVESTVGVGCRFWIELSLTTAALRDSPPGLAARTRQVVPQGMPVRTLLYVEDNPDNLELMRQIIEQRPDLHMLAVTDGSQGMEFARSHQPEVLLMDINLPGISGFDAMKLLRADPATAHIPAIAISANAMPRDIEQALAAGFCRYLTKPIRVNELIEALDMALQMAATGARPGK